MAPTDEPTMTDLPVQGALPAGLCGRLLGIGLHSTGLHSTGLHSTGLHSSGLHSSGDGAAQRTVGGAAGVVHSIHLNAGRALEYRSRPVISDVVAQRLGLDPSPGPRGAGPDVIADRIVVFGGSILALGNDSLAYELTADLDTVRRVDLAGQARGLASSPKRDPITGDLHVLAIDAAGDQAHVVVSSRAFTRTSRPIARPPAKITDLAITADRVVFVTDGFVSVARPGGDADLEWTATGVDAPSLVHAHDDGDTVVVYALTPSLERWTLRSAPASLHREVLDPAPQHFAQVNESSVDVPPRYLWTSGDRCAHKHDLVTTNHDDHTFQPGCRPGDLVFVTDRARRDDPDGGWLIGFVRHEPGLDTDLVVLDAADFAHTAIATIRIPRHFPRRLHSTWIPDPTIIVPSITHPSITHNEGDRP